jgi:hypothetical protein
MSEERLHSTRAKGDSARLLIAAGRDQLAAATLDLFLPRSARLSDWQRSTASALLAKLVRSVEEVLRVELASSFAERAELAAALSSSRVAIALPILERSPALREPGLVAVLLRRVEEHRFQKGKWQDALLPELIRDADEAVAVEAMALLIARSRRFDRFEEPALAETELPAELQLRLVWTVAAALRHYLVEQHDVPPAEADNALAAAAGALVAGYDEGETMEARALRLAAALHRAERLDPDLLLRALEEGVLPLFVAGLAVRCALSYAATSEILADPRGRGPALLLKAAAAGADQAAAILLAFAAVGERLSGAEQAVTTQLDIFEGISVEEAAQILRLWQIDPSYRWAIARLSPAETGE